MAQGTDMQPFLDPTARDFSGDARVASKDVVDGSTADDVPRSEIGVDDIVRFKLEPRCPKGHSLERKTAHGSWFYAPKTCIECGRSLKAGTIRYSCKPCAFHLCEMCYQARQQEMLEDEITITVYCVTSSIDEMPASSSSASASDAFVTASAAGAGADKWQVAVPRGATTELLKIRIFELYGVPPPAQALKRFADGPVMEDSELLGLRDSDALHLEISPASTVAMMIPMGDGMGILPMPTDGNFAEMMQAFIAGFQHAAERHAAMEREGLENFEVKLTVVMKEPERRCQITVPGTACLSDVMAIAMVELQVQDADAGEYVLQFSGHSLPPGFPVHSLGLDDDDVLVLARNRQLPTIEIMDS